MKQIIFLLFISTYSLLLFSQKCEPIMTFTNVTCSQFGTATATPNQDCIPPYTYSWSNGGTTQTITNLSPGTYDVTLTPGTGIPTTGTVTVSLDPTGSVFPTVPGENNSGGSEYFKDMCVDEDGYIYVIGCFTKEIVFSTEFHFANGPDRTGIFVAKYNRCGVIQLARFYGYCPNPEEECNLHIELLSNGKLAIAGDFVNTITFNNGGTTFMSYNSGLDIDGFLAVLDPTDLYADNSDFVQLWSNSVDRVKGLTVYQNGIAIVGSFAGDELSGGSVTLYNHNNNLTSDLFIGRWDFSTSLNSTWIKNYATSPYMLWNDHGMATAYVVSGSTGYIYFTFNLSYNGYPRTYMARVNATNGYNLGMVLMNVSGYNNDFHAIKDMKAYNGDLYMCGQWYLNSTPNVKDAVVYYYSNPNSNGYSTWTTIKFSTGSTGNHNCVANKLIVNSGGVYSIGTFNQNQFVFTGGSGPLTPVGTSHFAARLSLSSLSQNWITGIVNSSTTGSSFGNAFAMDNKLGVYYVGGAFTNIVYLNPSVSSQYITAANNKDAFLARFIDNGSAAYYRNLIIPGKANETTGLNVFPNPANDHILIKGNFAEESIRIVIFDLTGRIVKTVNAQQAVEEELEISVSDLPEGTYIIKVSDEFSTLTQKLVIFR